MRHLVAVSTLLLSGLVWAQPAPTYPSTRVQVLTPRRVVQVQTPQTVYVQPNQQLCPKCGKPISQHQQVSTTNRRAGDGYPLVYTAPGYESQYQACLRDCQFYASGNRYPGRFRGHPYPVSMRAGTGYSRDPNRPNHCYYREGRTLVARARIIGRDGKVWWSARYK